MKESEQQYVDLENFETNSTFTSYNPNDGSSSQKKQGFFSRILGKKIPSARNIQFDGVVDPPNYVPNVIRNQKYNIFTLIPLVLFNQFKFFFNFFFLLTTVTQFYPPLQTGYFISYIGPLALVLVLTMLKEAYDDWERYRRDKEANSAKYTKINGHIREETPSFALKVGDIIEVKTNQRVPADLVLLHTSEPNGSVFIRTDQLDGETDWKLRKAIQYTQKHMTENDTFGDLGSKIKIRANPPIENIYLFEGIFEVETRNTVIREPLTIENAIWGSTVVAGGTIYGMVVYTGAEMRSVMNTRNPRTKVGKVDLEINLLSKVLFVALAALAICMVGIGGFEGQWYIQLFRFMILLSCIIPLSLRVNLDFAKLAYSYLINNDNQIPNTVARNRSIPKELGRIQFLLTDKTGTLTQNDMVFKVLSLENGTTYTAEKMDEIRRTLKKRWGKTTPLMSPLMVSQSFDRQIKTISQDQTNGQNKNDEILVLPDSATRSRLSSSGRMSLRRGSVTKEERDQLLKQMVTAMALCHSVTPVITDDIKEYQASSPDEIALVKAVEQMNIKLIYRDQQRIAIENPFGSTENYQILASFPFSSETKRMGIIVKSEDTNQIIFYLKGADSVLYKKVPKKQSSFILDECEHLAKEGLRTLVMAQKIISEEEFAEWNQRYNEARNSLIERDIKTRRVIDSLEVDMECLGITGVEDKLQEDVCDTLENLRNAGIQIWMLTGDKVETATTIAITSGIKSARQNIMVMKEITDLVEINHKLNDFACMYDTLLVIDGTTLQIALDNNYQTFFNTTSKAPAVVCCRCSPTQKALIAEGIKKVTKKRTCAIGDGGNDVGMIQAADVGIGVEGKEGKQAALAADFSIAKFKYINKLVLWHGRLSYKRTATLTNFVIHRGLIISFIQAIFSIIFYDLSMSIYTGFLILGYTTVYTMFPVFSLISDRDVDVKNALQHPPLYKSLQKGRELSLKQFVLWLWMSLYQAAVIMLGAVTLFKDSYYNIVTITFSALVISELLNIITTLNKLQKVAIISICCSLIVYWLTIVLLKSQINVDSIDFQFVYKVFLLTLVSWLPFYIIKLIRRKFFPSEQEKIMFGVQRWVSEEHHEVL